MADPQIVNDTVDAINGNATLPGRYASVLARIKQADSQRPGRPGQTLLVAVSKTHPIEQVQALAALGQREFGENYVQEGVEKIMAAQALGLKLQWHLIGPLQSNKTRIVAEWFDWVQSVDRLKTAQRLSEQRPAELAPLNICLQVNISGEASKSGCSVAQASELALAVAQLPRLELRGLMAIPEPDTSIEQQIASMKAMVEVFDQIRRQLPAQQASRWDTLSMGMTQDLELAIAAGSTMVRVGTALFGSRSAR